jgi:hypothetical protein
MAQFQPFLIAGFQTGKDVSRDVWLVPQDAYPTILNARVRRGVLEKREGMTLLATTTSGAAITGIFEARYKGVPTILVLDCKRANSYNLHTGVMTDLSGSDTFTGGDADYFRFCTYYNKTYFVNGVDAIYSWDASTGAVSAVSTSGGVTITTCDGLFMLKSRLHFIAPTIGGVYFPDRIYYSDVGAVTITNTTQYYVYERDDVPVGYHALDMDHELILGRKSTWTASYTGDSDTPFRCVVVDPSIGCMAPFSVTEYHNPSSGRFITCLSNNHWLGFDGYQFRIVDAPLRDMVGSMNHGSLRYCQATCLKNRDALYLTYPTSSSGRPDRLLEYGIEEGNWTEHTMSMHCVASVSGEVDPSDIGLPSGHIGRVSNGYVLGGDSAGRLFLLDDGDSDNEANIPLEIRSAALNPFQKDRRKAYLGWIDFYVDSDSSASFTLMLYKDDDDQGYYKKVSVSCDSGSGKFWQRVNVGGECANFHRFRIVNDGVGNRPRIHAVCPWMRPGGRISTVSANSSEWPEQTWRLTESGGIPYIQHKINGTWTNYQQWG